MMSNPLVSIVTPCYNQAAFVEQTILSVLNQTYSNIEYIVIDGGSSDGSAAIIEKYADKLAYWVSEKDNGQSDAINKGLAKSSGQIFAYLNSDDLLEPNAVELVVNALQHHPDAALLHGKCNTIDFSGNEIRGAEGAAINFKWLLKTGMLPRIYQPACFFNLEQIKRTPLFDPALHFVLDYELLLWITGQGLKSIFIDKMLARYRWHASAKSSAGQYNMLAEKFSVQRKYGAGMLPIWWFRWLRFRLTQES
jgi:GT2 family glycosyltransferase